MPGAQFAYNNSSYVLLAAIIERVSGSGFEAFMRNAVFSRLGMRHCRVWNLESWDEGFAGQVGSFMQLGARTYLARYPDEELLLVVLDNSKNPQIDAIVQELTMVLTAC